VKGNVRDRRPGREFVFPRRASYLVRDDLPPRQSAIGSCRSASLGQFPPTTTRWCSSARQLLMGQGPFRRTDVVPIYLALRRARSPTSIHLRVLRGRGGGAHPSTATRAPPRRDWWRAGSRATRAPTRAGRGWARAGRRTTAGFDGDARARRRRLTCARDGRWRTRPLKGRAKPTKEDPDDACSFARACPVASR